MSDADRETSPNTPEVVAPVGYNVGLGPSGSVGLQAVLLVLIHRLKHQLVGGG